MRPSLDRRAVLAGTGALLAAPAWAAPPATDVKPWIAYEARLRARLGDAGGGRFDEPAAREVLSLTNGARGRSGATALQWHAELADTARAHAADLAHRDYVEHLSPETFDPSHRFWLLGRRTVGSPSENIAYHRGSAPASAAQLMNNWQGSAGHWRNLLNARHSHAGYGLVRVRDRAYLVGLYARPLGSLAAPLPFRMNDFADAREAMQGWDDLGPDLRPTVGAPQGAGAVSPQSPRPWLMQLSLRRQVSAGTVEVIGGPIFVMGA